jgi:hypothetical protein
LKILKDNQLLKLSPQPSLNSSRASRKSSRPLNSQAQATVTTKTTTMGGMVMVKETVQIHPAVQVPVDSPKALPSSENLSKAVSCMRCVSLESPLVLGQQLASAVRVAIDSSYTR